MPDTHKTKEALIIELVAMRQRVAVAEDRLRVCENADKELLKTKQILETILHGISEGVFLLSRDFKIVWANKALLETTGCKAEDVIGSYCYKITHNRDSQCMPPHDICPIAEAIKTGKRVVETHTHFDKDGKERFVEVTAYPVKDEEGRVVQFIHISRDITERVELENALKGSEANYRTIFDAANDGILVHDIETFKIVDINKKGCEMFCYPCDDMLRLDVKELMSGEGDYVKENAVSLLKKAAQGEPQLFEWMAKDKAGRLFWNEVNLKRAIIGNKYRLLAIIRDITERKNGKNSREMI